MFTRYFLLNIWDLQKPSPAPPWPSSSDDSPAAAPRADRPRVIGFAGVAPCPTRDERRIKKKQKTPDSNGFQKIPIDPNRFQCSRAWDDL